MATEPAAQCKANASEICMRLMPGHLSIKPPPCKGGRAMGPIICPHPEDAAGWSKIASLSVVWGPRGTEPWRLYRLVPSQETAMKKDHQKGRSRQNTANIGGAAYAPQQDEPHSKGDERPPNKPIGEAAYASRDPTKKKTRKT